MEFQLTGLGSLPVILFTNDTFCDGQEHVWVCTDLMDIRHRMHELESAKHISNVRLLQAFVKGPPTYGLDGAGSL